MIIEILKKNLNNNIPSFNQSFYFLQRNNISSIQQTRTDFNDNDLDYQLSTFQLLHSASLESDLNTKSNYFINSTGLNIKETDQESKDLLEETHFFDEMNEEEALTGQERAFNLESFYQEDGQQRHRISIDLTTNIIEGNVCLYNTV